MQPKHAISENISRRTNRPRWMAWSIFCALLLLLSASSYFASAQDVPPVRAVEGRVVDSNDNGLSGTIVYIKNMDTSNVVSLFADDEGSFRYGQLLTKNDYTIWAEYKGKKSPEKLLSTFELRAVFQVRLRIDTDAPAK
jgi:hypothetical protein